MENKLNPQHEHRGVLFLGTDTDVGKTFQAVRLIQHSRSQGVNTGVYKPVASGVSSDFHNPEYAPEPRQWSDAEQLCWAAGLDRCLLKRVCPQVFRAPLAPPSAAALEGRHVDEILLWQGADWWKDQCDFLIVEGAGGVMSPLSDSYTCLDLAEGIGFPVVLVAADRLGCVSHVLLAVEAIHRRGVPLMAVVLNPLPENRCELTSQSNEKLIRSFLPNITLFKDAVHLSDLFKH